MAGNKLLLVIEGLAALIVIWRAILLGSLSKPEKWNGDRLKFIGHSIAYPLMIGGAIGIVLQAHVGHALLLVGLALLFISERRAAR